MQIKTVFMRMVMVWITGEVSLVKPSWSTSGLDRNPINPSRLMLTQLGCWSRFMFFNFRTWSLRVKTSQ